MSCAGAGLGDAERSRATASSRLSTTRTTGKDEDAGSPPARDAWLSVSDQSSGKYKQTGRESGMNSHAGAVSSTSTSRRVMMAPDAAERMREV